MGLFSALGLGLKVVKGLSDRRAQKEANAANSPAGQVAQYEAAGLNPVPFMLGGGYVPQQATSIGDVFSEVGSFFERKEAQNHEQKVRETELAKENNDLRERLDDLATPQQPGYIQQYGGILPLPSVGGANVERDIQAVSDTAVGGGVGRDGRPELGRATVTQAQDAGSGTYQDPRVLDAEMSEARYGDLAQEAAGARNLYKDNVYNSDMQDVAERYGRDVAERVHQRYATELDKDFDQLVAEESVGTAGWRRDNRPYRRSSYSTSGDLVHVGRGSR